MNDWTIFSVERHPDGSIKNVTFSPLLALGYVILLAVLIGMAVRLWQWAL